MKCMANIALGEEFACAADSTCVFRVKDHPRLPNTAFQLCRDCALRARASWDMLDRLMLAEQDAGRDPRAPQVIKEVIAKVRTLTRELGEVSS